MKPIKLGATGPANTGLIPYTQTDIRGPQVQSQPGQPKEAMPRKKKKKAWECSSMVEYLPGMHRPQVQSMKKNKNKKIHYGSCNRDVIMEKADVASIIVFQE